MKRLALVTAIAATGHDEDMAPLLEACRHDGIAASVVAWDDPTLSWQRFDAALLRSPWDYTERLPEFLRWCERTALSTPVVNPFHVIRWNTDKHYLASLKNRGVPVVPTWFVEPDAEPLVALTCFLQSREADEFVVKPVVSAGSRDTQRYARSQEFAASNHIARLLEQNRSTMLQPYFPSVDSQGETALIYLGGEFSHAIRKSAQLQPDAPPLHAPMATAGIKACEADAVEQALAVNILEAVSNLLQLTEPLAYARIDLIRDENGNPCLLELELTEPSLFLAYAPGSAARFAAILGRLLGLGQPPGSHG